MSDESEESAEFTDAVEYGRNASGEIKNAIVSCKRGFQRRIESLGWTPQVILAAVLSLGVEKALKRSGSAWNYVMANIPTFSTEQLLVVLIGVGIAQTRIQARKFNHIADVVQTESMSTQARADGGRDQPRDEEGKFKESKTSGGGALGGAIAGAALGSSYGPAGTVFGGIVGAMLGDELEKTGEDSE